MTEDFIDQTLSMLDDYYPGSKRKRKEKPVVKEVEVPAGWDARPYKKTMPNGKDIQMFTLGALAQALGRPIITLRVWMKEGYLPMPPYRLPDTIGKDGVARNGRRLYSRPMIEAAVDIFRSNGIYGLARVEWSLYQHVAEELAEAWNKIRAEEMKTN